MTYQDLVKSFSANPRDVHTVPKTKKTPVWFHVSVQGRTVCVSVAKTHVPSSKIKRHRGLEPVKFDAMLDLYQRRKKGEELSKEATEVTQNQVYWYGIFSEMGL